MTPFQIYKIGDTWAVGNRCWGLNHQYTFCMPNGPITPGEEVIKDGYVARNLQTGSEEYDPLPVWTRTITFQVDENHLHVEASVRETGSGSSVSRIYGRLSTLLVAREVVDITLVRGTDPPDGTAGAAGDNDRLKVKYLCELKTTDPSEEIYCTINAEYKRLDFRPLDPEQAKDLRNYW